MTSGQLLVSLVVLQENLFAALRDKVPPAMDPPVESMLLKIFVFLWMGSMERKDEDVPEEEKLFLEEALGLTLRGLLRQAPTSEHFIFILKFHSMLSPMAGDVSPLS
ncbi:uncharacterized protein PHA67_024279 isoform 1-T1 [Liasis olivaceus]